MWARFANPSGTLIRFTEPVEPYNHYFRNLFFQIESIIVLQTICKTSWEQRGDSLSCVQTDEKTTGLFVNIANL